MRTIDMLVAVKAEEIMNDYGKLSKDINKPSALHPSSIYHKYIRILPEDDMLVSVDNELNMMIKADIGDTVRWNITTLNINTLYSCALVKAMPMDMSLMNNDTTHMMGKHVMKNFMTFMPVVNMVNPLNIEMQQMKDCCWMSTITDLPHPGTARIMYYECVIAIYREMTLMGYIALEPGIILDQKMIMS
ncbi:AidA/PixA family protein [Xenorhabdus sp. XENO-10]|uniref:AidA/PixA family protein n=1 Tax=Xenorhabdus yunnanensis TaxID=3025878 RepID=A0ABT5LAV5_9GAMM|nr:AidA/PixA family protein [Xenorhabdus yunnanensis]MDC9588173.1 AidA/PixA family protein [Xenorhabdus yunnanensis]